MNTITITITMIAKEALHLLRDLLRDMVRRRLSLPDRLLVSTHPLQVLLHLRRLYMFHRLVPRLGIILRVGMPRLQVHLQ